MECWLWKRSPRFAGRISFRRSRSKKPVKEICRTLHVSRKVVRRVIRSDATEFHYEREKQPLPKIGPWRDRLDALLLENDGKPARERLTSIQEVIGSIPSRNPNKARTYKLSQNFMADIATT